MPHIDKPVHQMAILAADDNDINRDFLHGVLGPEIARLEIVEDGAQALQAARERAFDVLLLDLHMPKHDGLQIMETLRRELSKPQPLFIAITADARKSEQDRLLAAGFDGFLTKPIMAADLIPSIQTINEHPGQPLQTARSRQHISAALNDAEALRALDNNRELLLRLRRKLLEELPGAMNRIDRLVAEGHWREAAAVAHKLAGGAAYVGAGELAEACREFELVEKSPEPAARLSHLQLRARAMRTAVLLDQSLRT